MPRTNWKVIALAAGTLFAWAGLAFANDDTIQLNAKKSTISLIGSTDSASEFRYAERAKADDDDLEDVHFRYNRGYARGSNGGIYILPRFYAFRRGYRDGRSGSGYQGGYSGGNAAYASNFGGQQPRNPLSPAQQSNPQAAARTGAPPTNNRSYGNAAMPSEPLHKPNRVMSEPPPPLTPPANQEFQYDGSSSQPAIPKTIGPEERQVVNMQPSAKKYHFPAYGEDRLREYIAIRSR